MIVSIFNDVIGPVMRGPSSSHCAAALRIGRIARDLICGELTRVLVEFDTNGSLPATHTSQGSDMGLFGGLLGWEADDSRLVDAKEHLEQAGIDLSFRYGEFGDAHPNTYRLKLENDLESHQLIAISTGGGMIEVIQIDGVGLSIGGDFYETLVWYGECDLDPETLRTALSVDFVAVHSGVIQLKSQRRITDAEIKQQIADVETVKHISPVLPVRSARDLQVPFQSCSAMIGHDGDRISPLWRLAVDYETARSGLTEDEVCAKASDILGIVRRSIDSGLAGTEYHDRVLGFQSGGFKQQMDSGGLLDAGMLNKIVLYTTALMEVKSSMGVIVAAPTAGACAAFPASCVAAGEAMNLSDDEIVRGMLAGGLIGVFIATHWSFAAEVGGCQAEGGSASAMSAAALVTFAGGTRDQAIGAASMAMQNMLGLICDPVANRVEVPCLGKNVMAASNAVSCANMALAGFDCVIPLDETIAAAKSVSERMPREHRCTALGGLSITPTSIAIQEKLAASCGCGSSCVSPQKPTKIES